MTKERSQIRVDKDKLADMITSLTDAYQNKTHIFRFEDLVPELELPENVEEGSLEHSLFLFTSILFDSRRDSKVVYLAGRTLSEKYDLTSMHTWKQEKVLSAVQDIIPVAHDDPPLMVYKALQKLQHEYDGDPRKIFNQPVSFDHAVKRLKQFYGIGNGKAALMVKNFLRYDWIEMQNPQDRYPKVDTHLKKMAVGNGGIVLDAPAGTHIHINGIDAVLTKEYRSICTDLGVDPSDICDAKWILGNVLCNAKSIKACEGYCPIPCEYSPFTYKSGSYLEAGNESRKRVRGKLFRYNFETKFWPGLLATQGSLLDLK